jgi:N-alpha-acetyltransferase 35, NatC auxiliary subunit
MISREVRFRLGIADNEETGRMTISSDGTGRPREDITDSLLAATQGIHLFFVLTGEALAIGQIVRAPDFGFLDALGALEIMDPKTDSGLIDNEDVDPAADIETLLPEEVIWVMDQLLAREVCH